MSKCRICKKILSHKDRTIKNVRAYYHEDCYRKREIEKGVPEDEVEFIINELRFEIPERGTLKGVLRRKELDNLIIWVRLAYDVQEIPGSFYHKLAEIENGNHKSVSEGIPYRDILDMLQRRKPKLDVQTENKKFKNGIQRLNYDLAVVVNSYSSYKRWKMAREIEKEETIRRVKEKEISLKQNETAAKNRKRNNSDDLTGVLDEIFGDGDEK